ncbi:MAG: DUF1858 domain-containing protein [Clostridiales bacterium]
MITKDMSIGEIVEKWPTTVDVFKQHGMGCLGCAIAHFESVGEGAMAHGIDIDALLCDLSMAATRYNPDEGKCQCGCGKH